ncbi:MAG: hypothetical protein Q8M29_04215 [Bacteroidota bacterium]|nr:hypothetical protein [Bacteroidota bacterium]
MEDKKYYFEFDEIVHYNIEIEQEQLSKKNRRLGEILMQNVPDSISDTLFLKELDTLSFQMKTLNPDLYDDIGDLFRVKENADSIFAACIPMYRDILVFKKSHKVVGIAKVCFECDLNHIVGAKYNSELFGQNGDYEKLQKLLYQK